MKQDHVSNYLRITGFQFAQEWCNIQENIQKIITALESLDDKPDIFVLPEMFTTGFSMDAAQNAETMDADTFAILRNLAEESETAICGSMIIRDKAAFYNRFIFVHPSGEIDTYDKHHLFTMGEENQHYTAGTSRELFEYKGWKIFPTVCYDLRFPVWCRNNLNYDLMINVANWPAPRAEVYNTLMKARAIENQCYAVGVNCVGTDGNNLSYLGQSVVVDAKGLEMKKCGADEEVFTIILDKYALNEFRQKFPVLKDGDSFQLF